MIENGSWIHAYLHRKEGDIFNSRYWYNKAGKPAFNGSLKEEWEALGETFHFLSQGDGTQISSGVPIN